MDITQNISTASELLDVCREHEVQLRLRNRRGEVPDKVNWDDDLSLTQAVAIIRRLRTILVAGGDFAQCYDVHAAVAGKPERPTSIVQRSLAESPAE